MLEEGPLHAASSAVSSKHSRGFSLALRHSRSLGSRRGVRIERILRLFDPDSSNQDPGQIISSDAEDRVCHRELLASPESGLLSFRNSLLELSMI